jgi:ABC-type antimicrobial peptide transport system permease subunit
VAESVEPALRFDQLQTVSEEERQRRQGLLSLALAIVAITGSVLLLSAAGIYAMVSFTVASRRREIGIRAALGAEPGRVLRAVLARAGGQLAAGAAAGLLLAEAVPRLSGGSFFAGEGFVMLPVVVMIVIVVGLMAAFGPARRGLSIQPTEALREE